ncbi:MAG: ribose-phosphate pyrophosphokinase [Alphaproteobacteria bacterium]
MRLLCGNANPGLAEAIARHLGVFLTRTSVRRFADGEIFVEILENVREQDVFVIQSTCNPANDHLLELLIAIDALKRGSAKRITAVLPYFGYARQDRKSGSRAPISAKLVANLLTVAGANRVLTIDLHAGQIQGFFDIPTDNLQAAPVFLSDIRDRFGDGEFVGVSPDVGGVARARVIADALKSPLAIIDKRRDTPGSIASMHVIGDVRGKVCLLIDDIVDSAGTLCSASDALLGEGAREVHAYVTHAVLSGDAVSLIEGSSLGGIVVTDTIPLSASGEKCGKIRTLSVSHLLGESIRCVAEGQSVSRLFDLSPVTAVALPLRHHA